MQIKSAHFVMFFNFYSKGVKDIAVTLNQQLSVDEAQPPSIYFVIIRIL